MRVLAASAAAGLILIMGCRSPVGYQPERGEFADYRAFAYDRSSTFMRLDAVPGELHPALRACFADTLIGFMTPAEVEHWNGYARGDLKVTPMEATAFRRELYSRFGLDGDTLWSAMRAKCPSAIEEADPYLWPASN